VSAGAVDEASSACFEVVRGRSGASRRALRLVFQEVVPFRVLGRERSEMLRRSSDEASASGRRRGGRNSLLHLLLTVRVALLVEPGDDDRP
jgi:hypothetical protein